MKFGKILSAAALLLSSNLSFAEEVPKAVIDLADSLMQSQALNQRKRSP